jgi:hypothetical protein
VLLSWLLLAMAVDPTRSRPRTRQETEAEHLARKERTPQEIRAIAMGFHRQLPREAAVCIGAIYVRYSTRFQDSAADQVGALYEFAVREKIFVPIEYVYFDLAVRGPTSRREGLDALGGALAARQVQVLLVFGTNRLFRKTYKTLQFIEEEVVGQGIRCIFAKSGIDTADEKLWRSTLHFHAVLDEMGAGMYADNIRSAQEGLFSRGVVFGTVSFGYTGEPITGELTRRKRPRCRLVISPAEAQWVVKIFTWFVGEALSVAAIVRRLNSQPEVPLPPRCTSGMWTRQGVMTVLQNPRYRGWWEYGRTQTVWQAKKDYARQIVRQEPLRAAHIEELRIVPYELWYDAQQRLRESDPTLRGRKPKDGDAQSRPKLLNGVFWCPQHERALQVGGSQGQYMFCPVCRRLPPGQRCLFSQLPRALALRLTCERLAQLVRGDDELVGRVLAACREEVMRRLRPDPALLAELHRREQKLTTRIKFIWDNPGETDANRREAAEEVKRLRGERNTVLGQMAAMESSTSGHVSPPEEAEVRDLVEDLGKTLTQAALGNSGRCEMAREVLRLLTGGRIELAQQGERQAQCGWLQGRFRVHLLSQLVQAEKGDLALCFHLPGKRPEAAIAFRSTLLAEIEGARDEPVTLEEIDTGKGRASWTDKKVPRIVDFDTIPSDECPQLPNPPRSYAPMPPHFLTALAEASRTAAKHQERCNQVQLSGRLGEIVGTDGRQPRPPLSQSKNQKGEILPCPHVILSPMVIRLPKTATTARIGNPLWPASSR